MPQTLIFVNLCRYILQKDTRYSSSNGYASYNLYEATQIVTYSLHPSQETGGIIQGGITADYLMERSTRIENVTPAVGGSWQPKYQQNSDAKKKKKPSFRQLFEKTLEELPEDSTISFYVQQKEDATVNSVHLLLM